MDINTPLPDTPYWRAYSGRFSGILSWADFDKLWDRLVASEGKWFVFHPEGGLPEAPCEGEAFMFILSEARTVIEAVRNRSYCGAVYVDDRENPTFVKAFDPYKMGAVCGTSGEHTFPRWVFSRIRPDAALPLEQETPQKKGLFTWLGGATR
jgi:hypothetical protein